MHTRPFSCRATLISQIVLERTVTFECPAVLWCLIASLTRQVKFPNPVLLQHHVDQWQITSNPINIIRSIISKWRTNPGPACQRLASFRLVRPFLTMYIFFLKGLSFNLDSKSSTKSISSPSLAIVGCYTN